MLNPANLQQALTRQLGFIEGLKQLEGDGNPKFKQWYTTTKQILTQLDRQFSTDYAKDLDQISFSWNFPMVQMKDGTTYPPDLKAAHQTNYIYGLKQADALLNSAKEILDLLKGDEQVEQAKPMVQETLVRISSHLYSELRQALLDCGPFDSNRQLQAIFAHPWLSPFRYNLVETDQLIDRVEETMAFLLNRHRTDTGKNALVLFLRVLSERLDPADECHSRLNTLADQLEPALNGG